MYMYNIIAAALFVTAVVGWWAYYCMQHRVASLQYNNSLVKKLVGTRLSL